MTSIEKIRGKEERLRRLQDEVVSKSAFLFGLPPVETVELKELGLRFVRLRNPKTEGLSLKKKQCDLWEFCWGSGALMAYVLANSIDWTGTTTIELGGGIGLATLALCSKYSTKHSVMTDLVADALNVFKLSTMVQPLKCAPETRVLNWNKPEEGCEAGMYDLVIGSDVLFMGWCAPAVANVAARCLSPSGIVLIVDPYRLNDQAFLSKLEDLGIGFQKTLEFPGSLIERLVLPVLDSLGSVVPVKRAKLLVASRKPIPEELLESLLSNVGLSVSA